MKIAITDTGRGPSLLFVHTGFSSFLWRDVIERLSSDYRCISIDAPGTGGSTEVPARAATLENSARAVVAAIDALHLSDLTLVVHDLGGVAGLAAAYRRPDAVAALAAVNTFGWRPRPALRAMLAVMGSRPVTWLDAYTGIVSRVTASAFGTGRGSDDAARQRVRQTLDRNALLVFHAYLRDARRESRIYDEADAALAGPLRNLPVVTIFGERNDPFGFQREWKKRFPDAWQIVVPGGHHFPMCDDPDLVARTLDAFHRSNTEE